MNAVIKKVHCIFMFGSSRVKFQMSGTNKSSRGISLFILAQVNGQHVHKRLERLFMVYVTMKLFH